MSDISEIRWEIDELIQKWKMAYPEDVFPAPTEPPTEREILRAMMMARYVLESLSIEIDDICLTRIAENRRKLGEAVDKEA